MTLTSTETVSGKPWEEGLVMEDEEVVDLSAGIKLVWKIFVS